MLFDLRSRGRRRTVQASTSAWPLLMGGGLVLFGVGAGNGVGGLLNAFNGAARARPERGRQSSRRSRRSSRRRLNPQPAPAGPRWCRPAGPPPVRARNYNASDGRLHASGKTELAGATQAWQRYIALTKSPGSRPRRSSPRAPTPALGNYAGDASAWEVETQRQPERGQGLRVPGGHRLRRQADPQGRPGGRQGRRPCAQGPAAARSSSSLTAGEDEPSQSRRVLSASAARPSHSARRAGG